MIVVCSSTPWSTASDWSRMSADARSIGYEAAAAELTKIGEVESNGDKAREVVATLRSFITKCAEAQSQRQISDDDVTSVPVEEVTQLQEALHVLGNLDVLMAVRSRPLERMVTDLLLTHSEISNEGVAACRARIESIAAAIEQFDGEAPARSEDYAMWLDSIGLRLSDEERYLRAVRELYVEEQSDYVALPEIIGEVTTVVSEIDKAAESDDYPSRLLRDRWVTNLNAVAEAAGRVSVAEDRVPIMPIPGPLRREASTLLDYLIDSIPNMDPTRGDQILFLQDENLADVQTVAARHGREVVPLEQLGSNKPLDHTTEETASLAADRESAQEPQIIGKYRDLPDRPKTSWLVTALRVLAIAPFVYFYLMLREGNVRNTGLTLEEQQQTSEVWLLLGLLLFGFVLISIVPKRWLQLGAGILEVVTWLLLVRLAIAGGGPWVLLFIPGAVLALVNLTKPTRQWLWDRRWKKNTPVRACRALLTNYGREWGAPGSSLVDSNFEDSKVQQGLEGELRTAEILRSLLTKFPGLIVLHSAPWPGGSDADIDHVLLAGTHVLLIDSKMWQPGTYSEVDGPGMSLIMLRNRRPFRGGEIKIGDAMIVLESMLRRLDTRIIGMDMVAVFSESGQIVLEPDGTRSQRIVLGENLESAISDSIARYDVYEGKAVIPALALGLRTYWETDGQQVGPLW